MISTSLEKWGGLLRRWFDAAGFPTEPAPSSSGYGSIRRKRPGQWEFEDTVWDIHGVIDEQAWKMDGKHRLLVDTGFAADCPDTGA